MSTKHDYAGSRFDISGLHVATCAYGENPHQKSHGLFRLMRGIATKEDPLAVHRFKKIAGSDLSHNNYKDLSNGIDAITRIATAFARNGLPVGNIAVGIKHGSVCGASRDEANPDIALHQMIFGNRRDLFGGVVITNFEITDAMALTLQTAYTDSPRILDLIAAPKISNAAVKRLGRKKGKCRMLINESLASLGPDSMEVGTSFTQVRGGFLAQEFPQFVPILTGQDLVFHGTWGRRELEDMLLAWGVGSMSLSNSITLALRGMIIGNGVAQTSRVSAARIAVALKGSANWSSVAYSDSFIPFPDTVDVLARAGVSHIFTASGSVQDEVVIQKMKDKRIAYCLVPNDIGRSFRH